MSNNLLSLPAKHIRATDTNSLLRLYDQAQNLCRQSLSRLERERVGKAIARIVQELCTRDVRLNTVPV